MPTFDLSRPYPWRAASSRDADADADPERPPGPASDWGPSGPGGPPGPDGQGDGDRDGRGWPGRPPRLLVGAAVLATGALLVALVATDDGSDDATDLGPTVPAAARDLATTLSEAGTLQRSSELTVAYAGALTSGGDPVVPQGDDRSSGDGSDGSDSSDGDEGAGGEDGADPVSYLTGDGNGGDGNGGAGGDEAGPAGSSSSSSSTSTTACPAGGGSPTSSSSSSTSPTTSCPSSTTSSSTSSTTSTTAPRPSSTSTTAPPPSSGGGAGGGDDGDRGELPGGEQSPETSGDGGAGSDPRLPSPSGGAGTSPGGLDGGGPTGGNGGGQGGEVPSATLTGVLGVGTRADRGSVLFTADDEPVVALIGELPAWRTLSEGVDDGADVRQLEENLVALGYGADVVVDESFTAETAAAVEAWETALGRASPDGTVTIGDVVFLGSPGDVLGHDAEVGDTLEPGTPVLRIGSEQRMVVADVDATEAGGWTAGSTVELEWADTTTSTGTVFGTGRDVNDDGDVELIVAVGTGSGGAGERRSGAEATVTLVNARRDGVVAVPVSAIVDHDGAPAVRVAGDGAGGTDEVVPVETGLVADGWVEITSGLTGDERIRLPT